MATDLKVAGDAAEEAFVLERSLFQESGVWFYQVPPGQVTTMAPRADSWDPEHPFLTGSLRVLQRGDACWVQLFEPVPVPDDSAAAGGDAATQNPPTLFAQCPLEITHEQPLDQYVHDCVDSSRYFMLRVEDEQTKRRAFVGIGFPDRTSAFNFKATLQDYAKYAVRQIDVEHATAAESDAAEKSSDASPRKTDLSLPQGTTIRIKLKTSGVEDAEKASMRRRRSNSGGAASPAKVPLIPPPPGDSPSSSAASLRTPAIAPPPAVAEKSDAIDDEDWGDFTSA
ncbi:hypothetical protein BBJ28_00003794 [Nothophytophthora sp. Chile5]|nr:hypothetical protein BBJ28_00003794 [Nothophytophthora sp. Chile5]